MALSLPFPSLMLKLPNFASSCGRLRQKFHQKACRTCRAIIFPHLTNETIDFWHCRSRCRRHFLNCLIQKIHVLIWQTTSKKMHKKACRTCNTIIFPHSTNQINDLWRCRRRCRHHFLNSLMKI